jgi:hypothetical protein
MLAIGFIFACKPDGQQSNTETSPAGQNPAGLANATGGQGQPNTGAAIAGTPYAGLGSIQIQAMRDLYVNCNSLDIIFYDTKFSLNQTDTTSIQTTLQYLLPSPVIHDMNCKPIGRITFWVQGELRREADIYVGPTCNYFIWIEDQKPVYINPLAPHGIQFFTNILSRGHELVPKQGQ